MVQLIKYSIIRKIKNFNIIFWPCIFPLIMGTLFYFGFGNMSEADFETVQAGYVKEGAGNPVFSEYLDKIEKDGTLIHVETLTEAEAKKQLKDRRLDGIFFGADTPYLQVAKSGMAQSVMQSLLESYLNGKNTLETVAELHPENMEQAVAAMSDYQEIVENVSLGGKSTNNNSVFFYALVGMACLYGCFVGMGSAFWLQANVTDLAARQCVSPVHRMTMILTEMLTSFFIHFLNVVILLLYLRYVLRMEFQGSMVQMLLISLVGCIVGVSMGVFVSSASKLSENIKVAIMLGISMTGSTLAGLMNSKIKFAVDQNAPIINKLNPAALITDAFYCINVYDDPERMKTNLITLLIMAVVLTAGGSFLVVRRVRYDSI